MIDITIKVPSDRVASLYAAHGRWLAGEEAAASVAPGDPHAELIDVSLKVPGDRVPDFYVMAGHSMGGSVTPGDTKSRTASAKNQRRLEPWTAEDTEQAAWVWAKLSDSAKALFSRMIDAPEEDHEFDGDELAETVGIKSGRLGIAGMLVWPSRFAAEVNRGIFWECLEGPEGPSGPCTYAMSREQADLFRRVRDSKEA